MLSFNQDHLLLSQDLCGMLDSLLLELSVEQKIWVCFLDLITLYILEILNNNFIIIK